MNRRTRRKDADGPKVLVFEAVNASQNISGRNLVDQDDFYPADGVTDLGLDEYDYDLNDFSGTDSEMSESLGLLDSDAIDEVYDTSLNDLGPGESFFDGDFSSADGAGTTKEKIIKNYQKRAVDFSDPEQAKIRREQRKESRGNRRSDRKDRQESRQDKRESKKDERKGLRSDRKSAKTEEIRGRAEFNKALSTQGDGTAEIIASMNTQTKSASAGDATKKMSTGMVVGIAIASVTLLSVVAYFVIKKK